MGGDEVKPSDRKRADGADEQRYEVDLDDGANTIDLMVTSEDEIERSYQLVVRRDARSSDATLQDLSLSAGTLSPAFNAATTLYTASVGNAVSSVRVTATPNHEGASVAQSPDNPVALDVGTNRITVTVTAEDGTTEEYFVVVTRDAPGVSSDATLQDLSLSAGTLSPAFDPATLEYTVSVGNGVTSVEVTATPNHNSASVAQSPVNPVTLQEGTNPITVTVTAEDATTTKTYTVRVTRDPPGVSSDANLGDLSLSAGTLSPAFDAAVITYTASVENAVSSVTVTATASHASASVAQSPVNPVTLQEGTNPITVTVTAEDGNTTKTYTVTVTRDPPGASSDADLGDLSLSAGTLSPAFDAAVITYTASVENAVSSVTVTATASHASASVAQSPVNPVTLQEGTNPITVTVTAEDGNTTKTYTVTVTRDPPGASSDADLGDLSLSAGTLSPAFDAAVITYTASVENAVSSVTVTATASHASASVAQSPVNPVTLQEGTNPITVTVTAEDGNTTKAYTVTVTRAAAPTTPGLLVSIEDVTVPEGTERDYTARLTTRPSGDVTVDIEVVAHADNPDADVAHIITTRNQLIFNENNWSRARTVTITVDQDDNESTEIANINHTVSGTGSYADIDSVDIKVTASDDDVVAGAAIRVDKTAVTLTEEDEDDGSAVVMVSLAVEPTDDVTVAVVSSDTNVATVDEATLGFTATNWGDPQEITVTSVGDADPADAEATVTLTATGGGYGSADSVVVAITIEDDEEATISVTDNFEDAEVVEGGQLDYNIILSAAPAEGGTVRVNLQVTGLATLSTAQVVFTSATATTLPVTVTTLGDSDSNDGTLVIRHAVDADDDSGYESAAAPSNIAVTVKDIDAAGVVVSRTSLSVEEGQTVTYTVRLTKAPSTDETVTVHLAGTGVNLSPVSLAFTPGDFGTPQTVTVTGHTDSNSVDDQATVVHTVVAAGGDEEYDGVTASMVRITVTEPSS